MAQTGNLCTIAVLLAACSPGGEPSPGGNAAASSAVTIELTDALAEVPEGAVPPVTPAVARSATAATAPAGRSTCRNIVGRLLDEAPEGRNVRAGPSVSARLIAVLPPPLRAEQVPEWERELPVQFEIIGSENGWLRIRSASFDETLAGQPVPRVFSGEGWISGRGVYVGLQTRAAFAAPSHDAPVLIGGSSTDYLDGWPQRGIAGCQGQWVLVDWERPPPPFEGQQQTRWADAAIISRAPFTLRAWAAGVCNIIETTCDGVDGTAVATAFRE